MVDSTVRGPILPVYIRHRFSWVDILLKRLSQGASVVSSAMMCAAATASRRSVYINDPHSMAFDAAGLAALRSGIDSIPCDARQADADAIPAHMSSLLVLQQHKIASLQYKFANVNWALAGNRKCSPVSAAAWMKQNMDSDPMESLFVPMLGKHVAMGWDVAHYTSTVSSWMDDMLDSNRNIDTNSGSDNTDAIAAALYCFHSRLYPQQCFDSISYLAKNKDLVVPLNQCTETQCWEHFASGGVTESRYGAFTCEMHATPNFKNLVYTAART